MDPAEVYVYQDQEGTHEITRAEILRTYFPWWSAQMTKIGKADQISEQTCVEDWCVAHWAWRKGEPDERRPESR